VSVGRARNGRVLVELLAIAAVAVAASAVALQLDVASAPTALFCLFFATQAVLVSHYWTLAGDFFDTLASKRLVPLFTVGMSAGGALGGALALGLMARATAVALVWAWAIGLLATAIGVVVLRGRLSRWRALAVSEEDETSVAGIRAALRHLRGSPLGRWLVVSALAMVLALFVSQYLYSEVLARSFPDEAALAAFLALYLTASNGVEILVEVAITPWLIRRVGVPTANLVHPLLTVVSFAGLAFDPRLATAVGARANRELLESALAGPVRNLAYNALPGRFRSRVRAFLEGIVIYSGMSLAGVALLAAGRLDARALAALGAGLAAFYLLANLRVRREYVRAIAAELRAGRLDLRELRSEIGPRELEQLAELWAHLVEEEGERPSDALLELAPLLAARGHADAVRRGLDHPSARLRAACLEALAQAPEETGGAEATRWRDALEDADPIVRRAAVRWLPGARIDYEPGIEAALRARLADPEPRVRAEAAARLGAAGESVLRSMLVDGEPAAAEAALRALRDPALAGAALARLLDSEPRVRAASLEALARLDAAGGAPLDALLARLADPDTAVRRAAVAALAARPEAERLAPLAEALRDPMREVRSAAIDVLAGLGADGARAARALLGAPEESAVGAALRVLGEVRTPETRAWLRQSYAESVAEAWEALLLARSFAPAGPEPAAADLRFLQLACTDAFARAVRIAFRALSRLEDEKVVRSVQRALRFAGGRARADALEVISHLGERDASQALIVLLERSPLEEKLRALRRLGEPPRDPREAHERARAHRAPWVRRAAALESGSSATPDDPAQGRDTMQRLLALRQVSLFSGLSLERLQAIERISTEAEYVKGEVIVREGEPGDDLFLLVEGRVDIVKDHGTPAEERLNGSGPGGYFGEMAVLDGSPRSATVVAASDVRVLVLAGSRLRELVHEMPELAFDLFRVLAERLRRAQGGGAADQRS
jgi:HEAT repeat protein